MQFSPDSVTTDASFPAEAIADSYQKFTWNSSQTRVNIMGRAKSSTHSILSACLPSTQHSYIDTNTEWESSARNCVETITPCP